MKVKFCFFLVFSFAFFGVFAYDENKANTLGGWTYHPAQESANDWSDAAKWVDVLSVEPKASVPGAAERIYLTRPTSADYPLTWSGAAEVGAFYVGDAYKGLTGDYYLKVSSGGAFVVNGNSTWACNAGTVQMTIDAGGSASFGNLMLGRTANSSAVITNRGTLTVGDINVGGYNGSLGQIDVFGTMRVNGLVRLGLSQEGTTGRIVLHEGATLDKPLNDDFSVGYAAIGELVLDGGIYRPCASQAINLGASENLDYVVGRILAPVSGGLDASSGSCTINVGQKAKTVGEIVLGGTASIGGTSGFYVNLGCAAGARGRLSLAGQATCNFKARTTKIGAGVGGYGEMSLSGNARAEQGDITEVASYASSTGILSLADSSFHAVSATSFDVASGADSYAEVTIADDAELKTQRYVHFAQGDGSFARLRMRGGQLRLRPYPVANGYRTLMLGTASSRARLEGWGTFPTHTASVNFDNTPLGIYLDGGVVVANGEGVDRDLVFSHFSAVGTADSVNASGTNGWYAVNHGRIVFPHFYKTSALEPNTTWCVGDYHSKTTPDLINACSVALKGNVNAAYLHASLYAADHGDVPEGLAESGLHDKVIAVWRLGYALGQSGPTPGSAISYASADLTFRFDPKAIHAGTPRGAYHMAVLHRYDASTSTWRPLASVSGADADGLIEAKDVTPCTDAQIAGYNIGWFALVDHKLGGTALLFR